MGRVMPRLRAAAPLALRVGLCALLFYCTPPQAPGSARGGPAAAQGRHYVCAPCGSPCDATVYDHPGTCPACGMPLVEQGGNAAEPHRGKPLAILVFDGAEIIDFAGPWEVFGAAGFDVYTVAATTRPITTAMGMTVVPRYAMADAPQPAVLLVPGGGVKGVRADAATLRWVAETSRRAEQTLSVCNGAFILASAGLLDGLTATTTDHLTDQLGAEFPHTRVVSDRRFVDNGRIVTAAGLSAGIDGALHVVEKLLGKGTAQATALGLEYDWHPDGGFVRAALADHVLPEVDLDSVGSWAYERTEGTTDHWEIVVRGTSPRSSREIVDVLGQAFTRKARWVTVGSTDTSADWRLDGADGKAWRCAVTIEAQPPAGGSSRYVVRLTISRANSG